MVELLLAAVTAVHHISNKQPKCSEVLPLISLDLDVLVLLAQKFMTFCCGTEPLTNVERRTQLTP